MTIQFRPTAQVRLVLALLLATAAPLARAADWPMFGHDAKRSFATPEKLPDSLDLRWAIQLPALEPAWLDQPRVRTDAAYHPIIVGQRLIVASSHDDSVTAYELSTGRLAWRFFTQGPIRYAPAVETGRLFVGSDDGYLYALSVEDGKLLWKLKAAPKHRPVLGNRRVIDTWCVRGGPVVEAGKVYFAAGIWPFMGVFVCCADVATGKILWCNSGDGSDYMKQPHSAMSFGSLAPQGPLAIAGERLLVPNGRSMPASLARDTGAFQYFQLNNKVGGDQVSAGGDWGFDFGIAFDPESGLPVANFTGHPVFVGNTAYVLGNNEIRTFDLTNPETVPAKLLQKGNKKRVTARKTEFPGVRVLIAAGDRLYAGGDGWVGALELPLKDKAKCAWKREIIGTVVDLAAASGCLLATTEQGTIYCLGNPVAGSNPTSSPTPPILNRPAAPIISEPVKSILADSGITGGYAVVLGASGEFIARELAALETLHVVILEPDVTRADELRRRLSDAGLYARRIAVITGEITGTASSNNFALPPYFASLVVADRSSNLRPSDAAAEGIYRILHPYIGTAYLPDDPSWRQILTSLASRSDPARAQVASACGSIRLARRGGLPGAGSWTHENADAANTRASADSLVKAPLGILWYGGSSHEGILPRHGHGPQPQVCGGRIFIMGIDMLRALDAFTGRILWEAPLPGVGSFFNHTRHNPGANGTGSNLVSTPDAVYIANIKHCVRLDPATGKQLDSFALSKIAGVTPDSLWSFLGVSGDLLVGGASPPSTGPGAAKQEKDPEDREDDPLNGNKRPITNSRTVGSRVIFVLDRRSGKLLWSRPATIGEFRNNAICIGGGRLYAIDRSIPAPAPKLFGLIEEAPDGPPPQLLVLDLLTGKQIWTTKDQVFGTSLSYSAKHDILIETGRQTRDILRDEPRGMRAYKAATGLVRWTDLKARGPGLIRNDAVILEGGALDLSTGKPVTSPDPVTGYEHTWHWARNHGCNTPACSENLITFRSGAAGFYDLARNGGTGNFGGFRSSCTNNLVIAEGLVCAPDYTRTCICSYPLQTSLALVPDPDAEYWTFQARGDPPRERIRRIGINLGAPGDRLDDAGTLWLEYPATAGRSPKVDVAIEPENVTWFRQHSSTLTGPMPWVAASGASGIQTISIDLKGDDKNLRKYIVRLYFTQPGLGPIRPAVMDVFIQNRRVDAGLNVVQAAGGVDHSLVREYRDIHVGKKLQIDLKPAPGAQTILCGIEVIRDKSANDNEEKK